MNIIGENGPEIIREWHVEVFTDAKECAIFNRLADNKGLMRVQNQLESLKKRGLEGNITCVRIILREIVEGVDDGIYPVQCPERVRNDIQRAYKEGKTVQVSCKIQDGEAGEV